MTDLDTVSRRVHRGDRDINLTNKEYSLLEYLMRNPNRVLTRTQIAEHVWDYDFNGMSNALIDQVHRLMHLWKTGDVVRVDEYLDARGLRRHRLFHQLLQALIELASPGSDERSLLESISNHVAARGIAPEKQPE